MNYLVKLQQNLTTSYQVMDIFLIIKYDNSSRVKDRRSKVNITKI